MAIDFLPRRSHQLIATPITPRLPPRFAVLFGSSFHLTARLVVYRLVSCSIGSSGSRLVLSSSHPARLTRPHCPISSRSGGVGVCRFSSKQQRHGCPSVHHLIPSSHPIPVMERLVRRLVSCVSLGVSSPYTGSSTKDVMKTKASKRTRKNGEGTGTRNRGVGRDEGRNENGNTTGTGRWQHKNGKQASKQARATETYDAIMGKNKTPLILFRPTPSPWVLIGSPASISPPPPGRGMRG